MPQFIDEIQSKNLENEITGYLFEDEGYFLQYFEGKKAKVDELMQNIENDTRHKILYSTSKLIFKRRFEDWSMNYYETTTPVEMMFFNLLIQQKKKAMRYTHPVYGFILRVFYKSRIWKIADQMQLVTQNPNIINTN